MISRPTSLSPRIPFVLAAIVVVPIACVGADPDLGVNAASDLDGSVADGTHDGGAADGPSRQAVEAGFDESGAATIPVHVVRNPSAPGHPAYGASVDVKDLVVTGRKSAGSTHGFFAQDATSRPWGGVYAFVGYAPVGVVPGDVVRVRGVYKAYRGFDQIEVWNGGSVTVTGHQNVPEPLPVSVADVAQGGARARALQSMRLVVSNVTTTVATNGIDFRVVASGTTAPELAITSYVANDTGASPFPSTAGQTWALIRGFGYESGASDDVTVAKLAPQSSDDLVGP